MPVAARAARMRDEYCIFDGCGLVWCGGWVEFSGLMMKNEMKIGNEQEQRK